MNETSAYHFDPATRSFTCLSTSPIFRVAVQQHKGRATLYSESWERIEFPRLEEVWICAACLSRRQVSRIDDFKVVMIADNEANITKQNCILCDLKVARPDILAGAIICETLKEWPDRKFWTKDMVRVDLKIAMDALLLEQIPADYKEKAKAIFSELFEDCSGDIWGRDYHDVRYGFVQAWPYVLAHKRAEFSDDHRRQLIENFPAARYAGAADFFARLDQSS